MRGAYPRPAVASRPLRAYGAPVMTKKAAIPRASALGTFAWSHFRTGKPVATFPENAQEMAACFKSIRLRSVQRLDLDDRSTVIAADPERHGRCGVVDP